MLDCQKQGVLALVHAALTGEKQVLPEGFQLEAALETIVKHGIVAMALEGALKCGLPKSDPSIMKLLRLAFDVMGRVEAQDKTAQKIFSAFEDAKIDFMPVKGAVMRGIYPKPEYRSMGDMDVLIRLEQYPQIREIMLGFGFEEKPETDHELAWNCGGLYLELHKRLVPSYNGDFYEYYGDGWQMAKPGDSPRHEMAEEDHFAYVFAHMAKHYRDGGVGIRQMCDVWLLRRKYPDMNEAYIHAQLNKMGLLDFYNYVLQTLDVWFGAGERDARTDLITQVVFETGSNDGGERRTLALGLRVEKDTQAMQKLRWQHMFRHIFLPRNEMIKKYPLLDKKPALLPVMWIYRIGYIIFKEPFKIRRQYGRFQTLTGEHMDSYQQSLSLVGLKYDRMTVDKNGFV